MSLSNRTVPELYCPSSSSWRLQYKQSTSATVSTFTIPSAGFDDALLWNFIWSRCLYDQTWSLHESVWQPGNTALARKQHESLRKHVPRRGDDWQRAAFSNSISLLPPAAKVGAAWRQVVTLSFLPSKSRGHDGDLPAPLPPAKHVASPQRPGWLGATQVLCAQLPC